MFQTNAGDVTLAQRHMTELELAHGNGRGVGWGYRHTGEVTELWEAADKVVTFWNHMSNVVNVMHGHRHRLCCLTPVTSSLGSVCQHSHLQLRGRGTES